MEPDLMHVEDVDFLGALGRSLSGRYYEELRSRLGSIAGELSPGDLTPPSGYFLVALVDDEVAACVGLRRLEGDLFEVKHLWVDPSQRGAGLGRSLLEAAEERARQLGADRVVLDTAASLHEAIALYRSAGYVEIDAYNDNDDAQLWFEKQLGGEPRSGTRQPSSTDRAPATPAEETTA